MPPRAQLSPIVCDIPVCRQPLQLYIAVVLNLAAVAQHLLHDLVLVRTVLKLNRHLEKHEVDRGILDPSVFFRSLLHKQRAVRAVNIDIVGLFFITISPFPTGIRLAACSFEHLSICSIV